VDFPNPYLEERPKSKGELTQQWASFFLLASAIFGLNFTDTERRAFAVCIGALMREYMKFDLNNLPTFVKMFIPKK
jgi:hypothetical protein